jgi:hypothetical protein
MAVVRISQLAAVSILGFACSTTQPPAEPKPGCNPIIGDDCLTPFPSSFYEAALATTETGVVVSIPEGVLPVPSVGSALSPAPLNQHDGVSPNTPFIVYFAAGVDPTQLPTLDTLAATLQPSSVIQVLDFATGARVPVFAELDVNAGSGQRQALLIRPQVPLQPATRYVIALVGLHDPAGHPIEAAPFIALRDRQPLSQALAALADRYEDIFAALGSAGVARGSLTLAWDVITASADDATGHVVGMRDTALAMVDSLTWTVTATTDTGSDPDRLREVVGTFQVPSFLTDDSLTGTLNTDADGNPVLRGIGSANFVVDIPQCAGSATGPLPVQVFGHGLFGDAQTELETPYQKQVGNFLCMVQIGTDWIGLAAEDETTVENTVLPDLNQAHLITDRLQQAHVNAQVLTRLFLTRLKDDPSLAINGSAVTDGSQVYYYGISNGGIQGTTFMALSEDVSKGVLNVPGCEWSTMIFRSSDFEPLFVILQQIVPDPLDEQVVLAILQVEFDTTDGASFAGHILQDPLPGAAPNKQILVQEAINDAQVPNIATRVLVRTLGLPGLDLEQPVFGVTQQTAPLPSAYTQWDVMPTPVPPTGDTPSPMDNGAHEEIRQLTLLEQQIQAFLTPAGMVTQTCTGPCVCSLPDNTCVSPPGLTPQ